MYGATLGEIKIENVQLVSDGKNRNALSQYIWVTSKVVSVKDSIDVYIH